MYKAQLSLDDKTKIKALLHLHNVIEFMYSEESQDNEEGASGPSSRLIKPLRSKRSNINAVLDTFYEAHMSKRQKKNSHGNNQRGQ